MKRCCMPDFLVILVLATALAACGRAGRDSDDAAPAGASAAQTPASAAATKNPLTLNAQEQRDAGIVVQQVQASEQPALVTLTGALIVNQDRIASVLPQLPGRIVTAPVPAGAAVRAGQVLATIRSIELGEAQSAYRQARSEAAVTHSVLERARKLAAEEIIATKDLQRATADDERAQAALRAAADKLKLLGAHPDGEALYTVVAPISGTVTDKRAVPGAQVESEPLFTVADLASVWLEADIYEKDLRQVAPGASASVSVSAYPNRPFSGRLTFVSPTMDTSTRTVKARIELPNPEHLLKPGMFATAQITGREAARVLVLPAAAVTLMEGKSTVFVQRPAGDFEARQIELVTRPDGSVEVRAGLRPGERVATAGAYALKSRVLKSSMAKDD